MAETLAALAPLIDSDKRTFLQRLADFLPETWPAQMARSAYNAVRLPGDVAQGRFNTVPSQPGIWSDEDEARAQFNDREAMNRAVDLAGTVMGGSYAAAPAQSNAVGMGVRALPTDNYTVPLSKYADKVYRETSPELALEVLPHSGVSAGYGPMGAPRQFYADVPELALGQGTNKGVRVGYDASALEGQINTSKPMWAPMFEAGSAEYIAAPARGQNIRDAVKSINIDKAALASAPRAVQTQYGRLVEKLKSVGWDASDSTEYIELVRKFGLAASAAPLGVLMSGASSEAQAAP